MENKANTDYQKFVSLGDQEWEIVDLKSQSFSFMLLEIRIHYFLYGGFLSPIWIPPPKKKKVSLKNGSAPSLPQHPGGRSATYVWSAQPMK